MAVDLSVEFAEVEFRNPVLLASGGPSSSIKALVKAGKLGAGGIVMKSARFHPGRNARPRYGLLNTTSGYDYRLTKRGAMWHWFGRGEEAYFEPEYIASKIKEIKQKSDVPFVASIGPDTLDEARKLAIMMEAAGADMLELNGHYPAGLTPREHYEVFPLLVKVVKESVSIPVVPKPMYAWLDPKELAKKLEKAGADGITALGFPSLPGLEIDVETGKRMLGGVLGTGSWFRPVALWYVGQIASVVKIPISGVSGVVDWRAAVEYILLGATTVQVCTPVFAYGFGIFNEITKGMMEYMKREEYTSIESFRGKSLAQIEPPKSEYDLSVKAVVEEDKCIGIDCGECVGKCIFDAIRMEGGVARIDLDECDGCGLCESICLVKAISLKKKSEFS